MSGRARQWTCCRTEHGNVMSKIDDLFVTVTRGEPELIEPSIDHLVPAVTDLINRKGLHPKRRAPMKMLMIVFRDSMDDVLH